jgi:hypothetical protein
VLAVVLAVTLGACGARVDVSVNVAKAGNGSVTVEVRLPPGTAGAIEDLRAGLPVADLRRAGWAVDGPRAGVSGTTVVSASHDFSALSQLSTLMADIAGSGAAEGRPFRLSVTEHKGALEDTFRATGTVDLRCSLSCFDDPALAARVGYPLGLPPAEVSQLFGKVPAAAVTFRFSLALPGRRTSSGMQDAGRSSVLALTPVLGEATPLAASTESVNTGFLRLLAAVVSAGALVVLFTAAWLVQRRRRGRPARRAGRRPGFPVTGGR